MEPKDMNVKGCPTEPPRPTESSSIDKLVGALAKAVPHFESVVKDRTAKVTSKRTGGTYSYNYADLASVLRAVTPALSSNGLALIQRTVWDPHLTALTLESRLVHESGQWISATYPLPTAAEAQEMGSHITYARRYSVTALLGIASEEDDDGNSADGHEATHAKREPEGDRPPAEKMPECPSCNLNMRVILSKFPGKKYYSLCCKQRFGPGNSPADEPGAEEAAELFTDPVPASA